MAKTTIDQEQEIGRRKMTCYSQIHWQQCEVIAARREEVYKETKKPEIESQNAQCMAHLIQGPAAQPSSVVSEAFTIFQHNVPSLSILNSYEESKTLAYRHSN